MRESGGGLPDRAATNAAQPETAWRHETGSSHFGHNLTHGLLDILGQAVVAGQFARNGFPSENEISRQHGVSRSVTREAVKMLIAKGLLGGHPGEKTVVKPISCWNLLDAVVLRWLFERRFSTTLLKEFYELRVAIEPEAAALAARFAGSDDLQRIDEGLERMRAAEAGRDDGLEAEIAFHRAILRSSANPFYAQFRDLVTTASRLSACFDSRTRCPAIGTAGHVAVRDAIVAQEPAAARAAMRSLIGAFLARVAEECAKPAG